MCGLTGFVSHDDASADELLATVRRMRDTLAHRGPDDTGEWLDREAGFALGFRLDAQRSPALAPCIQQQFAVQAVPVKALGLRDSNLPDYYRNRTLLKTEVTAEDVVEAALFLNGPRSAKTTPRHAAGRRRGEGSVSAVGDDSG